MAKSYTNDQWELLDLPRQIAYEASKLNCPVLGAEAKLNHARLLERHSRLTERIRRQNILDRWYMRRYRGSPATGQAVTRGVLSPMGIDEVMHGGKIVDQGG